MNYLAEPTHTTVTFRLKDFGFKTAFVLFPVVMAYILITDGDGCGDPPRDFYFFPIAGATALLSAFVWSLVDKQRHPYTKLHYALQICLRFFLAYNIMIFGASKILDAQFPPSITALDTRVADMRPSTVAWTFFGYSYGYGFFIGCGQVATVLLLLFRKTATLGAFILVTIMSNVVFVNFAFDVCVKFFSCTFLVMSFYLLLNDAPRLINVFLLNRPTVKITYPELFPGKKLQRALRVAGILVGIFSVVYPSYYIYTAKIKYGEGARTELYGTWAVDSLHHSHDSLNLLLNTDSSGWKKMLFDEGGLAYAKSWKKRVGSFSYTTDAARQSLDMKGTNEDSLLVVKMTYRRNKDTLYLNGSYGTDPFYVRLHLLRRYYLRKEDQARK